MSTITKVAIAGASGALGSALLDGLVKGGFEVTALVRSAGKIPTTPASAREVVVDFASHDSLAAALKGQDAVVSALGSQPGTAASQKALAQAAADTGVKRFIPSDFGSDLENAEVRKLAVFRDKLEVRDELARLAGGTQLTWTAVSNGAFLDWGLEHRFLLDPVEGKATLWDGGEHPVSVTRLPAVGQAVVAILKHPDETENRTVYVHEAAVSLKQLVGVVREYAPGKQWTVVEKSTEDAVKQSNEALSKGISEPWVFIDLISRASFSKVTGAHYVKNDNALLGVRELSGAELKAAVKEILARIPDAK